MDHPGETRSRPRRRSRDWRQTGPPPVRSAPSIWMAFPPPKSVEKCWTLQRRALEGYSIRRREGRLSSDLQVIRAGTGVFSFVSLPGRGKFIYTYRGSRRPHDRPRVAAFPPGERTSGRNRSGKQISISTELYSEFPRFVRVRFGEGSEANNGGSRERRNTKVVNNACDLCNRRPLHVQPVRRNSKHRPEIVPPRNIADAHVRPLRYPPGVVPRASMLRAFVLVITCSACSIPNPYPLSPLPYAIPIFPHLILRNSFSTDHDRDRTTVVGRT